MYANGLGSFCSWFPFNEGIIKSKGEVVLLEVCSHDNVDVWLDHAWNSPNNGGALPDVQAVRPL
jgi:hypothetical protein